MQIELERQAHTQLSGPTSQPDGMRHAALTFRNAGARDGQLHEQLLDAQLADLVPSLERTIEEQAMELAVARTDLSNLEGKARRRAEELHGEAQTKQRQLDEADRRWRCHRHDGETKLRLLQEQVRSLRLLRKRQRFVSLGRQHANGNWMCGCPHGR